MCAGVKHETCYEWSSSGPNQSLLSDIDVKFGFGDKKNIMERVRDEAAKGKMGALWKKSLSHWRGTPKQPFLLCQILIWFATDSYLQGCVLYILFFHVFEWFLTGESF